VISHSLTHTHTHTHTHSIRSHREIAAQVPVLTPKQIKNLNQLEAPSSQSLPPHTHTHMNRSLYLQEIIVYNVPYAWYLYRERERERERDREREILISISFAIVFFFTRTTHTHTHTHTHTSGKQTQNVGSPFIMNRKIRTLIGVARRR